MNLVEVLRSYQDHAPVDLPGPQRQAQAAWRLLKPLLLSDEIRHLGTALSHALDVGEGRREFDRVMDEIRARLLSG